MPKAGIQLKFKKIMVEGRVVVGGDVGGIVLVVVEEMVVENRHFYR